MRSDNISWNDTLKGLLGSFGRGATLGFSDYLNDDLKQKTQDFSNRNPGTAALANLLGAIGGTALGSDEAALASRIGLTGSKLLTRLMPTTTADLLANRIIAETPILSKLSASVVPSALSSAIQGGTYAYNTSANDDPNATTRALQGATVGGVGGAALNQLLRTGTPIVRNLLNRGSSSKMQAVQHTLDASGLDPNELINKLSKLNGISRTYDVDPVALGSKGLLSTIAKTYPKLASDIRNTATDDISRIGKESASLTNKYLGETLPASYSDYIKQAADERSRIASPLYEQAKNSYINIGSHPELLNHYVLGADFNNYLNRQLPNLQSEQGTIRDIIKFIDQRNQVLDVGKKALKSVNTNELSNDELNNLHASAISDYLSNTKEPLTLSRKLIRSYLDERSSSRPDISREYRRLEPNTSDDITRLIDSTKRAIQEVSPEDAAAQQAYRDYSIPVNQADLARTLTRNGTQDKLASEVTNDYIEANNKLREAASNAGLPDNSRPLTRYVLDEAINTTSKDDVSRTPSSILSTINSNVRPRLESVFDSDSVNNLLQEARNNEQLINNRRDLTKLGAGGSDPTHVDLPHYPTLHRIVYDRVADIYRNLIGRGSNTALVDFLHKNPMDAIDDITNFVKKNPTATLQDYQSYMNSVLGNLTGETISKTPHDDEYPKWDPIHRRAYWDVDKHGKVINNVR